MRKATEVEEYKLVAYILVFIKLKGYNEKRISNEHAGIIVRKRDLSISFHDGDLILRGLYK